MRAIFTGLCAAVCSTFSFTALAQDALPENLGNPGTFALSAERLMGVAFERYKLEDSEAGVTTTDTTSQTVVALLGVAPTTGLSTSLGLIPRLGFDYFPIKGLSLGTSLIYIASSGKDKVELSGGGIDSSEETDLPKDSTLLFHPRVGYAIAFNDTVAVWPRLGLTYLHGKTKYEPDQPGADDVEYIINSTALTLEGFLALSPVNHFAILVGPFADIGVGGKRKTKSGGDETEIDSRLSSFGIALNLTGFLP